MAPESIGDGIFSEKSDVVSIMHVIDRVGNHFDISIWCILHQWAFGVTCWEIYTGGKLPYPGVHPVALLNLIESGERLKKPKNLACCDDM